MTADVTPDIPMGELLGLFPGAQRALFRHFHIGGCASCGFRPEETLAEVCHRNDNLDPATAIGKILEAHEQDSLTLIAPPDLAAALKTGDARLIDIRTREEFDAARIPGSHLFNQELQAEMMASWPKDALLVVVDHLGARALDAAAYFTGHGFTDVRALHGGIDAWSAAVDPSIPRYTVE